MSTAVFISAETAYGVAKDVMTRKKLKGRVSVVSHVVDGEMRGYVALIFSSGGTIRVSDELVEELENED